MDSGKLFSEDAWGDNDIGLDYVFTFLKMYHIGHNIALTASSAIGIVALLGDNINTTKKKKQIC